MTVLQNPVDSFSLKLNPIFHLQNFSWQFQENHGQFYLANTKPAAQSLYKPLEQIHSHYIPPSKKPNQPTLSFFLALLASFCFKVLNFCSVQKEVLVHCDVYLTFAHFSLLILGFWGTFFLCNIYLFFLLVLVPSIFLVWHIVLKFTFELWSDSCLS